MAGSGEISKGNQTNEQVATPIEIVGNVRNLADKLTNDPKALEELTKYLENQDMAIAQLSKEVFRHYAKNLIPNFLNLSDIEKTKKIDTLSLSQKRAVLTYARLYDDDIGIEITTPDPSIKDANHFISIALAKLAILESTKSKVDPKALENRFSGLASKFSPEQTAVIGGKTIDKLTAADIYTLRQTEPKILSRLFLVNNSTGAYPEGKDAETEGNTFVVNFSGNKTLDKALGAGDIIPDEVGKVKINGVVGVRGYDPRPGFYEEKTGRYLPIHSGYTIEIIDAKESQKWKDGKVPEEILSAHFEHFKESRSEEILNDIDNLTDENSYIKPRSGAEIDRRVLSLVLKENFNIEIKPEDINPEQGVNLGANGPHKEKVASYRTRLHAPAGLTGGNIPPMGGIVSSGAMRSETGTTLCSRTARLDAGRIFHKPLPAGDAIDVQRGYGPVGDKKNPDGSIALSVREDIKSLSPEANFADVFTGSKSTYGHRCLAFKKDGNWMILDPYTRINGQLTNNPIPLDRYPREIRKVAGYKIEQSTNVA